MNLRRMLTVAAAGLFAASAVSLSNPVFAAGKNADLKIESVGENMKFNKAELTASEGSQVTVTFKNNSTSLSHNWVLTIGGKADAVATAGMSAGEAKGYVKAGDKNVLAVTPYAKPGKTVKVTFKAPKKGTYDFVCTSPGHAAMMKGKFIVK